MRYLTLLFILTSWSSVAQDNFAPLGAEWKYTLYNDVADHPYHCQYNVCFQKFGKMEVVDTTHIQGKLVSVLHSFYCEDDDTCEVYGLPIYLHSRNDSVFYFALNEFHLIYDFTAEDGDTITIDIPTFYQALGTSNGSITYPLGDSILTVDVVVSVENTFNWLGEVKKRIDYSCLGGCYGIRLQDIHEGIGSPDAFFGQNNGPIVASGCYGVFICYNDPVKSYLPEGCGCNFPGPYPARKFAPIGAEWLFEGWSKGLPNSEGCDNGCVGNYNLYRVEGEKKIDAWTYAEIKRYSRTKDSDWIFTGDITYFYDLDGVFYTNGNITDAIPFYPSNIKIGDSIWATTSKYFPEFYGDDEFDTANIPLNGRQVVQKIDTINIDGSQRKKITFLALNQLRLGEVIEGIGPLKDGLLGTTIPVPSEGCSPRLVCYRDSLIIYSPTECGCDFPMGPLAVSSPPELIVKIFPNPAYSYLEISNQSDKAIVSIEIIDPIGRVMNVQNELRIDVSGLSVGVYMLKVNFTNNFIVRKFLKL